ncbi:MAG: MFS transporter [Agathobacter sp.]|nr:MFS transporter [Agathobacter sp.]
MIHLLLAVIYIAFISLGLPDCLLGSAWPVIYQEINVPVSYAGIISMVISAGTIVSSLQSDRLIKKLGTGKLTALSVLLTAVALWGFSTCSSFWMLILWAIPYGLGAGSVDAALNNYVALHYKSHHMSWLHCMWGIGASVGPYIMSFALTKNMGWNMGYRIVAVFQIVLTFFLFISLPLWKGKDNDNAAQKEGKKEKVLSLWEIVSIPGAKQVFLMFFCYCALESTAGLWASSYLVLKHGLSADLAASLGSLFYVGITVGRAISGFVTMKLNDNQMIRLGQMIVLAGILLISLPLGYQAAAVGLVITGLGCAPIYPCVVHSTPTNFGEDKSQAVVGVQMACAYVGSLAMPPLFGILANHISVSLYPVYLCVILMVMLIMHIQLLKRIRK